jgi:hypothetical protein
VLVAGAAQHKLMRLGASRELLGEKLEHKGGDEDKDKDEALTHLQLV